MTDENTSALVLFSGGQDSTTCLAWALERFERVETIGFDYKQRHSVELRQRSILRTNFLRYFPQCRDGRLGEDHTVELHALHDVSETALTRDVAVDAQRAGLPNTFVPGRNILFLTFAAAVAWRRGIKHIVAGMCETDFSGYPDCRDDTLKAMQVALNLGMDKRFVLHTPLMFIDKAETWRLAEQLGGQALIDLIVDHSHTCYHGERERKWAWGYGCGQCPACELRAKGFAAYRPAQAA